MLINKHGIIVGGVADRIHKGRFRREEGAWTYIGDLKDHKALVSKDGWWRVKNDWWPPEYSVYTRFHRFKDANLEIGYRRCRDIIIVAYKTKRKFRWRSLKLWVNDYMGKEFGLVGSLDPMRVSYVMNPPHLDSSYRKRKTAGEFTGHKCVDEGQGTR